MRWTSTFRHAVYLLALLLGWGGFQPLVSHAQALPASEGMVADSTELRVLRQFYYATGGDQWTNHTNWPTTPTTWANATLAQAVDWYGVGVNAGDVNGLYLERNHLSGQLPASFGGLRNLGALYLSFNQLAGRLPASMAQLTRMNQCQLAYNQFSGDLTGLCDQWYNLQSLDLSHNQLTGLVPGALGGLPRLSGVGLNDNQLTGPLPAALGTASTLWVLNLTNNHLTGPIPGAWGQLSSLSQLFLSFNQLTGPLPDSLGQLHGLSYLDAHHNQFTGTLPVSWKGFRQLARLNLAHNQLSGPLPDSLQATYLNLDANQFSGKLPASYATARNLFQLTLDGNQLTSLPDFHTSPYWPSQQITITGNYLEFDSYERNLVTPGQYQWFYDYGQRARPGDTTQVVSGAAATLNGRIGGTHNHYQWQRQVGGQWVNIPGQTQPEMSWATVTAAESGLYRTAVTNDWVIAINLTSPSRYLDVVPYLAKERNRPDDASQNQVVALTPPLALAEDSAHTGDINFVRSWSPRVALTDSSRVRWAPVDSVAQSTQYLDGLGRPVQTVLHQASPQRRDMVQPQAYDGLGREPRQYLPYPAAPVATRQGYHAGALVAQDAFYRATALPGGGYGPPDPTDPTRGVARTGVAYSETLFEASPLNRVVAQGAPGEAWQLSGGHITERFERPNVAADSVPRFTPGYDPQSLDPGYQGFYAAGELWGTDVSDAHGPNEVGARGYRTIEWKDKLGQVVGKQVEAARVGPSDRAHSRWLRTAYVYDDFSHLRFVLQPEATKRVLPLGDQAGALPASALPFLFHYRYDGRGRQIAKQVPGQDGETVVVYDQLDRPILSQDPMQRTRQQWLVTKYDVLGRVVLTGVLPGDNTLTQASLQTLASADTAASHQYEVRTQAYEGYTYDHSLPRPGQDGFGGGQVLSAMYYDDYDFNNDGQPDVAYDPSADSQFPSGKAPVADALRTQGLVTRTLTRVLDTGGDPLQAPWLTTTTFYDERGRPVQVQTTNARLDVPHGTQGTDLLTTQLDFTGKVVQSVAVHTGPSHLPVQVRELFTYDHTGRLLTTKQQLPGEAQPALLTSIQYNELGQATRKTLGTGRLRQDVDYAYNIRGWLTSLNDPYQPDPADLFNLSLHYERGFTTGYEQYNGNLTGQTWRGRDGVQRAYGYVYDPLNRLLQGDFVARQTTKPLTPSVGAWNQEQDNYRLAFVSHDDNGNILTLRRQGLLQNATHLQAKQYGAVDNLTYAYAGNRLLAVDDAVSGNQLPKPATYHGAPTSLAGDFQEAGVKLGEEYLYDANGNLTQDKNKGITGITYNHLNLPRQIHFGQVGDSIVFRYTAAGQKVAKLVYQTGKPTPQRTDYLGPYQYEQDSLKFFPHAEGRVLRFVSYDPAHQPTVSYQREFTFKDHLGNLRLAYRAGQVRTYMATLEQDSTTHKRESQQFDSLSVSPAIVVRTPYSHGAGQWAALLNAGGNTPRPLGPLTQLWVQKGDTVTVSAYGYYPQAQAGHGFWFSLASFLAGLVGHQPSAPVGGDPGRGRKDLPLLQVGVATGLPALTQASNGVPLGYLRLLVFDKDSALVSKPSVLSAQTQQVQLTQDAHTGYQQLRAQVIVGQDGYVTAYVGNESDVDVFFDDVSVEHRQGLQVQETQYDPAGLELAGLVAPSPGIRGLNNYRFNGKEFQADLGLAWNHQDWRFFDPQLLRWHSVDPLLENDQEGWTPYQFGLDNTMRYGDPEGLQASPSPYIAQDPRYYIGVAGLGAFQGIGNIVDRFYAFFSNSNTQTIDETPRGEVAGYGVKASIVIETKAETKIQPTFTSFFTMNSTNKPQGSLVKVSTSTKVSSVTKGEVSGKVRGADVKLSAAQKFDLKTGAPSTQVEGSVGLGVKKGAASATVSAESDAKRKTTVKAALKVEIQTSERRKSSASMGIGFN